MAAKSLAILHLSDLHFSHHVDPSDPHAVHSFERLSAIESVIDTEVIDKVLVTGDLTESGDRNSLILAREWLFKDIPCGVNLRCGLKRPDGSVAVVPGNHDAFNISHPANGESIPAWSQRLIDNRQRSLAHYNAIFPEHAFPAGSGCHYEFLPVGERLVFFVYVDTCFLGDAQEDPPSRIEQVALGNIARDQVRTILDWFSAGVEGKLAQVPGEAATVAPDKFASSLKVLVAHHYLLPPKGRNRREELRLRHRRAIFADLASADFDVYLSGHKHVADTWSSYYGDHFDKRGRIRHLLNMFRRAFRIGLLPYKLRDERGRPVGRKVAFLSYVFGMFVKQPQPAPADEDDVQDGKVVQGSFIEEWVQLMKRAVENPNAVVSEVAAFVAHHKATAQDEIDREEVEEIQSALRTRFKPEERERLKDVADLIQRLALEVASRPFLHVVCGTAGKRRISKDEDASFNIYRIEAHGDRVAIEVLEYHWDAALKRFTSPRRRPHSVFDNQKASLF